MNNSQGALYFGAGIDMTQWRQNMQEMRRDILGLSNTTQQQTRQMDSSFRMIGTGLATYFSGAALGSFVNQIINVRGEFQKTEIAFGTMLKSTDKAKDLMGQMVELAAKTPFSLQDVSAGAKQLLAFQVPAEQVVDTLTRMGNIAAGLGVPLARINLIYGQVMAKGKLAGDDLRQFTEAGIPMLAELAKKFGKSTAEISKMVSAGKIGFKDVQDVLFGLTNEGGMFFNLMEKQSKSLSGQIANLGDAWDQMLNKLGESNEGVLSDAISGATYLVEHYEDVLNILTVLIATYGTYRAALIAIAAVQQAQIVMGNVQAFMALAKSVNSAKDAQLLFNMATKANPYVLAATALAALATAVYVYSDRLSDAEETQRKINRAQTDAQLSAVETKTKIQALVDQIKAENTTNEQRATLLKQVHSLSNGRLNQLTVEAIRTGKATDAINTYIKALEREAKAKALQDILVENNKTIFQNQQKIKNRDFSFGDRADASVSKAAWKVFGANALAAGDDAAVIYFADVNNKIAAENKKISEEIRKSGPETAAAITTSNQTVADETKKAKKEIEKIYGLDTLKGLQQRIDKLNEIIETSAIGGAKYNSASAEKSALEKRLKAFTQTFEEEINETKRQIQVRDQLLKSGYSKEVVDAMFPQVKDKTFLEYLQKLGSELEKRPGIEAAEDLVKLKGILDDYTGAETFIDNVNKQIDELKSKFSGDDLIEKLEQFKKANLEVATGDDKNAKNNAIDKAIEEEIDRRKQAFAQILAAQKTFEERSLALQKEYDQMKALAITDAQKAAVDREFSQRATDLFFEQMQGSEEWAKIFTDMNKVATDKLEEFKRILQQKLSEAKTIEEKIKIGEFIDRINETIRQRNPYRDLARAVKSFGDESLTAEEKLELLRKGIVAANGYLNILEGIINDIDQSITLLGGSTDNAMGDILHGIKETIAGIKEAMQGFEDLKESQKSYLEAKEAGDTFGQVMSGLGMVGAAVKIVGGAIKAISGWLSGDKKKEREIKKQAAALKGLEDQYNALAFAAERAFGAMKYDGQRELIRNLEAQKIAIANMMRAEQSKKKSDKDKIAGYQSQIQAINQSIVELKEGIIKDVLQTDIPDMASKLGDALLEAFSKGESGIEAVNRAFDDLVKNMLRNQLNKLLEGNMKPVLDNIRAAMGFNADGSGSFNGLTEAEIADLRAQVQAATQQGQQFIEAYSQIFEGLASPADGLKGDIKGITEKTAGALEAQINNIRLYQAEALAIWRANRLTFENALLQLVQIEYNTRRLHSIDITLAEMNGKMKKGLAGIG